MARKKQPADAAVEAVAANATPAKMTALASQAFRLPIGLITREQVKDMLRQSALGLSFVAPLTKNKMDDLAAVVFAKAAEDGQVVDAIYDLIAAATTA